MEGNGLELEQKIIYILLGVMLFYCGTKDFISRQISIVFVAGVSGFILMMYPFGFYLSFYNMGGGLLIGIVLIVISKITRGQIGLGDGLIFCTTGLGLGFWPNLCLLLYSLTMAAAFSGFLFLIRKKDKVYTIPFVPFVCVGYWGVILL
jgi:leader peptidase (prepilin peptidase)/N-methyltransferase